MPSSDPYPRLTERPEAELAEYHPLSTLAVAGLIFGLISPVAIVGPALWAVPLVGVLLGGLALRRIARETPVLGGRRMAMVGLILSVFFGLGVPAQWLSHRWLLAREARQFAEAWLGLLQSGQPQKALQLTLAPEYRQPFDESLWGIYRDSPFWRGELESYVSRQPMRALLALGDKALVRYYRTESVGRKDDQPRVTMLYAVSFDQAGRRKTFFLSLTVARVKLAGGRANWQLTRSADTKPPDGV